MAKGALVRPFFALNTSFDNDGRRQLHYKSDLRFLSEAREESQYAFRMSSVRRPDFGAYLQFAGGNWPASRIAAGAMLRHDILQLLR